MSLITPSIFVGLPGWPCKVRCVFSDVGTPDGYPAAPNGYEFILDVNGPDCDLGPCTYGFCSGGCERILYMSGPNSWHVQLRWYCYPEWGSRGSVLRLKYEYEDPDPAFRTYFIDHAERCAVSFINEGGAGGTAEISLYEICEDVTQWNIPIDYTVGDRVKINMLDNYCYTCYVDHTSDVLITKPGSGSNWQAYWWFRGDPYS